MDAVNKLLDSVKEVCLLPTDAALAERLGVSRQLVSQWRRGWNPMSNERIAELAAMARVDGPEWMARIQIEGAKSREEKALWRAALDRLAPAAVVAGVALLAIQAFGGDHSPATGLAVALAAPENAVGLYIMRNRLWAIWP